MVHILSGVILELRFGPCSQGKAPFSPEEDRQNQQKETRKKMVEFLDALQSSSEEGPDCCGQCLNLDPKGEQVKRDVFPLVITAENGYELVTDTTKIPDLDPTMIIGWECQECWDRGEDPQDPDLNVSGIEEDHTPRYGLPDLRRNPIWDPHGTVDIGALTKPTKRSYFNQDDDSDEAIYHRWFTSDDLI